MLNEHGQVLASHGDAVVKVWCVDAAVWTLQKKSWASVVGIIRLVWRIQDVLGGAITVKKVLITADDKRALRTKDSATRATIMRHQPLLVTTAQRHVADLDARSKQVDERISQLIGATNLSTLDLIDRTAKHFTINGERKALRVVDEIFSFLMTRANEIEIVVFLVAAVSTFVARNFVTLDHNAIVVIAHVNFRLRWFAGDKLHSLFGMCGLFAFSQGRIALVQLGGTLVAQSECDGGSISTGSMKLGWNKVLGS